MSLINSSVFISKIFRSRFLWGMFFLCIIGIFLFIREWQRVVDVEMSSWSQTVSADCGVVLTGGAGRIREGFALLENNSIKKLIISGVNNQSQLQDIFPSLPFYPHVNEVDVILEKKSQTTYGNAQQSMALIEALQCRDIVLITSKLHMYRSFRTFKASLPHGIDMRLNPVVAGSVHFSYLEISVEVIKSLFYSFWAY